MMTTEEILTGIKNWVVGKLNLKQNVISDLADIRSGAQAGATSVQPADILSYFDNAVYDSGTHRINFYHGQSVIAYIDASPFIVDGMVDDVRIENGYLVIDFNTASGKQDISIPLTDIFNPNNYYTKNETDTLLTQKQSEINEINTKIDALSSGVKVSLAISPSTIYKGSDQSVTLTGTMTNGTPTVMKLMDGNTQLKATTTSPITHQLTANILTNTKSYQVIGETLGLTLNASASLNARYPIYYGFGSNASSVASNANRYSPTTSAAHTYEKTSSTNGQSFYILIPTDITDVSNFVMNGAPFVMDDVSTQTINGVSYKVHKSSNTYNSGTTIKVTAS